MFRDMIRFVLGGNGSGCGGASQWEVSHSRQDTRNGANRTAGDAGGPRVLAGGGHHAPEFYLCHFITRKVNGSDGPVSITMDRYGKGAALLNAAEGLLSDLQLK